MCALAVFFSCRFSPVAALSAPACYSLWGTPILACNMVVGHIVHKLSLSLRSDVHDPLC